MSQTLAVARPGLRLGLRPESTASLSQSEFDAVIARWLNHRVVPELRSLRKFRKRLQAIDEAERQVGGLDLVARNCVVISLRESLAGKRLETSDLVQAFALIRLAMEQSLGLRLHDEQLYAGWCLLTGNCIEMQTGEGKTVTAVLPAIVMALAGVPVHVITANEYLVQRDCRELNAVYQWFGLRSGIVLAEQDESERRSAYACDIVYCTHQQVVFDYLRDSRAMEKHRRGITEKIRNLLDVEPYTPLLRGLCFAIVDEIDSVLIDDARTPLILAEISSSEDLSMADAAIALAMARGLEEGLHYTLRHELRQAHLSKTGLQVIRERTQQLSGTWQFERYRHERISQALTALYLYRPDVDYLVQGGRVELIDQSTGRPTPQRRLQHGLHRILEVKERCNVGDESNPVSSLSFQRFFTRYHRLCGMSGTVWEARQELHRVYGPRVVSVPTAQKSLRKIIPTRVAVSRKTQLELVARQIEQLRSAGRSVLIGTRTVQLSDQTSQYLSHIGIEHTVLNARQDTEEASVISQAGRKAQVTVATNMAGRGTDIKPDPEVIEAGGLHVINLEMNDSRRIDRQLHGRSARQGDPGSCQDFLSLDDELIVKELNPLLYSLLSILVKASGSGSSLLITALIRSAQSKVERRHHEQRLAVSKGQTRLQRALAIGGGSE
ncbi:DEAD/DEAH box helicase [Granulosicoccus antarcticus]|uniref:Protein translocase subunit SecA n=1 Tax=Granulosicoccus antarcticus IMCC3135 TaxID=1192854 RepID=A0A2Z2NTK2_9GAMM|nr:DEAD/DEAH box helicase [Granulosicoccus antarcticus]ASJ70947.1 Protein translocase subunit SecA [Granulosicoccus antarcticus IMCC3135]